MSRNSGVSSGGATGTLGTAAYQDTSAFEPAGAVAAEATDRGTADSLRDLSLARVAATLTSGATTLAVMLQNRRFVTAGFASVLGSPGYLNLTGHTFQAGDKVKVTGVTNTRDEANATLQNQVCIVHSSTTSSRVYLTHTYNGAAFQLQNGTDSAITLTRVDTNMGVEVLWKDWMAVNPCKILSATNPSANRIVLVTDIPLGMATGTKVWIAGCTPSNYNNATATGYVLASISTTTIPNDTLTFDGTGIGSGVGAFTATSTDTNTASIFLWQDLIDDIAACAASAPAKKVVVAIPAGSACPFWAANVEVRGNCVRSIFGASNTSNGKAHYSDVAIPWNPADATIAGFFANAYQQMLTNWKAVVTAAGTYASVFGVRAGGICRDTIELRVPNQQSLVTLTALTHFVLGASWLQADNSGGLGLIRAPATRPFIQSDIGAVVWGSFSTPASNGIQSNTTITALGGAVVAGGITYYTTATISKTVTADYTVPATTPLKLVSDVTNLGYTNSNCAKDWLYLAGVTNVLGTSRFGNYALVASGGCATVAGTDGTGYTPTKMGSKSGSTGAVDVFNSMLTTVFNGTEQLIGAYLTSNGFPNIQQDLAGPSGGGTGVYSIVSGNESKDPTTLLPLSGDAPQWAVIVDKACTAFGARGIHTQQSLDESANYAYWSNTTSPSVQTRFAPTAALHTSARAGFQFTESEFEIYPEGDYPSGSAYTTSMSSAIGLWRAVYIEHWPPQPAAYEAFSSSYATVAQLQAWVTNKIDFANGNGPYVLPANQSDMTKLGAQGSGFGQAIINDASGNLVVVLTQAMYGVDLRYDAASASWWVEAIATVPTAIAPSPQAVARGAHIPQFQ